MRTVRSQHTQDLFRDGGEMGALMASIDWAATPLGPVGQWPQALRTTIGLLLRNRFPILLWWGPRFVQIYNDAYRPVTGEKHPRSMGQPASECWAEIWHVIGPMVEAVFRGGPATTSDDLFLLINRKGFLEETHFKFAYSPVPDETVEPTGIGGVIATVAETTEQVYGERQLRTLRELGARAAEATTAEEACAIACETLQENTWDVPFALIYLLDKSGQRARLAARVGFEGGEDGSAPPAVDLQGDAASRSWPLARVLDGQKPEVLREVDRHMGPLPKGRWDESPRAAIALPLASPDQPQPYGVLICGVSPHRALDDGYRTFFELAAQQVVTAIRNARALETERRRAESLAELDRAKTLFFSNVSHEFRTPLTLLMGPLEEALASTDPSLPDQHRGALTIAHRNALRLLKLVNALLDFSRIEAGKARVVFEPVDLAQLTENLASVFRSAVEKGGLTLRVECASLDEPVWVDRDMWEKIVLNLLSNAFKFTFNGEIAVRLRAEGDHVLLEIADTGIGIAESDLPRIFDRFHRIHGVRSRTHEGSGIGLSLVHDIVRLHGGTIDATSTPGRGTTFRVRLPRGHAHLTPEQRGGARGPGSVALSARPYLEEALRWLPDAERGADAEPRQDATAPGAKVPERPARILLADDNADMRLYVRGLLAQHWTVETAADGREALEKALEAPPDLVLSDVMMPQLDGFGLLQELRRHPETRTIPVILLSARAGEESKVDGLGRGADDYLVKPFSAAELVARVGANLELSRLRRAVESELRDSNEELERRVAERTASLAVALRELETFSHTVAHDLRAPLRAMRQLSDLLLEDHGPSLGASGRDYARRIGEAAARMDRLTSDLLEWSRLTRVDVCREPLDLPRIVGEVLTSFSAEISRKAAVVRNETQRLPAVGDAKLLGEALGHLVRNALTFTHPNRAPHVRIATEAVRGGARIWVEDKGVGIAAVHRPKLFRVFERVGGGDPSGTGMGLALAKKAVERMGGEIGVASSAGAGSRFFIELPLQRP